MDIIGKHIRFNDKDSPLGYVIGLATPGFRHWNVNTITEGFMRSHYYDCIPYPITFPKMEEFYVFMRELKKNYNRKNKGLEKVIDMLRIEELDWYINNYDEMFNNIQQHLTEEEYEKEGSRQYDEWVSKIYSSRRFIDTDKGMYITFAAGLEKIEHDYDVAIIKSDLVHYKTKRIYAALREIHSDDLLLRCLTEEMLCQVKGKKYTAITIGCERGYDAWLKKY
jgi:hypothetical protein